MVTRAIDSPFYGAALRGVEDAPDPAGCSPLFVSGRWNAVAEARCIDLLHARRVDGSQRFSAIFAANDQMACGAALALHRRPLRVPEDISLVGFDDLPTSVNALPLLSTVHQPACELGGLAAATLLRLLAGNTPTVVLPAPRMIARESSRRRPGGAAELCEALGAQRAPWAAPALTLD